MTTSGPEQSGHSILRFIVSLVFVTFVCCITSQGAQPVSAYDASLLSIPPRAWAEDAAKNEIGTLHHPNSYLRYRMHLVDEKGDRVREVIESREGSVARLIGRDGKPLTPSEDLAEQSRLRDMLNSPATFARHIRNDDSGKKLADSMIRLLPTAMIYTYVPGQPQSGLSHGAKEVVMDYAPDPSFHPPSTTAEALTGLRGRIWIDAASRNVVRMEGEIFKPVNFGWGFLAHVYPGGKLVLEQAPVSNTRWIYTRFSEQVRIRAVLIKPITASSSIETSGFQVVPPLSYQDAIHLLLSAPATGR